MGILKFSLPGYPPYGGFETRQEQTQLTVIQAYRIKGDKPSTTNNENARFAESRRRYFQSKLIESELIQKNLQLFWRSTNDIEVPFFIGFFLTFR